MPTVFFAEIFTIFRINMFISRTCRDRPIFQTNLAPVKSTVQHHTTVFSNFMVNYGPMSVEAVVDFVENL
jgi:hypothetical protein